MLKTRSAIQKVVSQEKYFIKTKTTKQKQEQKQEKQEKTSRQNYRLA